MREQGGRRGAPGCWCRLGAVPKRGPVPGELGEAEQNPAVAEALLCAGELLGG